MLECSSFKALSCLSLSGTADLSINWQRNLSFSPLHLPHLLMPTFDLVVVGSGGGPYETNLSSSVSFPFSLRVRLTLYARIGGQVLI